MRFEKVSKTQYLKDVTEDTYLMTPKEVNILRDIVEGNMTIEGNFTTLLSKNFEEIYDEIELPKRATRKSAGYDFFAPYDFTLHPGESIKLATGIRIILDDDKFLMCAPRSGHGFKARIQLDNTIGIIDADYSDSDNEGHIHLKLTNDSRSGKVVRIKKGEGMMQAVIMKYFTVDDDEADALRNGGLGSTNK